jgi:hypothetical protein
MGRSFLIQNFLEWPCYVDVINNNHPGLKLFPFLFMTVVLLSFVGRNKKLIHNFGGETSRKTSTWYTE